MLFIHAETCLSFYFEVLYSWNESFFQGFEIQEKGGLGGLWTAKHGPPRPGAHSGLCKKNDLNLFSFSFLFKFYFILFSTLADGLNSLRLTGSTASCKKKKRVFI